VRWSWISTQQTPQLLNRYLTQIQRSRQVSWSGRFTDGMPNMESAHQCYGKLASMRTNRIVVIGSAAGLQGLCVITGRSTLAAHSASGLWSGLTPNSTQCAPVGSANNHDDVVDVHGLPTDLLAGTPTNLVFAVVTVPPSRGRGVSSCIYGLSDRSGHIVGFKHEGPVVVAGLDGRTDALVLGSWDDPSESSLVSVVDGKTLRTVRSRHLPGSLAT
jgi:hypothetical protein